MTPVQLQTGVQSLGVHSVHPTMPQASFTSSQLLMPALKDSRSPRSAAGQAKQEGEWAGTPRRCRQRGGRGGTWRWAPPALWRWQLLACRART